ncbi:N-acetylmuramic acid 6-phosphate etherase [Oceanobacillus jeddahense]|uniref:N-acetylmuramic acid 6-phosphate etherase n=1 Tax=Oceanobacillus jeddahense TaxID=1462527 RepID=A0ABY5JYH6_9BACI|nr:N-acetylmuramic acid 6-phosphate etherase [Oceanobacillus jeddahense]UUI05465.1 N-acetylmuramic acid 6-phosphate etherase [Oceanobacillus jeddahense]
MGRELIDMLTEKRNENSYHLHEQSTYEILQLMNEQDKMVPDVVEKALPQIEKAVEVMVAALERENKVIYLGAGTSGRLGVLDASECPPTFGVTPDVIQGIIAGGDHALRFAIEGAEDNEQLGGEDVEKNAKDGDVIVGIASSGRTPYVLGALKKAKALGLQTIGISCNQDAALSQEADIAIELPVGPEVVTGSTRLKAGTAQKLVLNMLSTATMVRTGKVYENLMINLQAKNKKLRHRAVSIIKELTQADDQKAAQAYDKADGDTKAAILTLMFDTDVETAKTKLEKYQGNFVKALGDLNNE